MHQNRVNSTIKSGKEIELNMERIDKNRNEIRIPKMSDSQIKIKLNPCFIMALKGFMAFRLEGVINFIHDSCLIQLDEFVKSSTIVT